MADGITILVVEDEVLILNVLREALADGGFDAVLMDDGAAALAELEAHPEAFRALITDIRLGSGPDGWEVAHRARELIPAMPIVYMSGDSSAEWTIHGVPNSIMVCKPFAPSQIITAVSALLNQADSRPA